MKIQRVNIYIPSNQNTHRKYLYNEMLDLINKNKIGGEFNTHYIKLNGLPEALVKTLEDMKIVFERIKK